MKFFRVFYAFLLLFFIVNFNKVKIGAISVNNDLLFTQDDIISEDLTIEGGNVNLNGFTITVLGNVTQTGGRLKINNGTLIIEGDYTATNSSGWIYMENEDDYMLVKGNFTFQGKSVLTAGLLEVKGNFMQLKNSYYSGGYDNFQPTGSHKVLLSGIESQTVNFENPSSNNSRFNHLELNNEAGITYTSKAIVTGEVSFRTSTYIGELALSEEATVKDGIIPGDLYIFENYKLFEDLEVLGDLFMEGNSIDLNGKTLLIAENMKHSSGDLKINKGTLNIEGNYTATNNSGRLYMEDEEDYMLVKGDFIFQGRSILTAGLLEVKGDFSQIRNTKYTGGQDNFKPTGSHKVLLSGNKIQTVNFANPASKYSRFNNLELNNEAGITFTSKAIVTGEVSFLTTKFINPNNLAPAENCIIKNEIWPIDLYVYETWTLQQDIFVHGKIIDESESIDLNNYNLKRIFDVIYDDNKSTYGMVPVDENSPYVEESVVIVLANINNLVKNNHYFVGWNTSKDGDGDLFKGDETFTINEDLTLYAQWIRYYVVAFEDFDGTVIKSEEVITGDFVTAPEDPERIGYTFTGWDKSFNEITSDLVVTATYKINTYIVTFIDYNHELLKLEIINHNNAATAPENPERIGYTFTGWDKSFSEITSNLVVTATYKINTYTVIFVDYNDEILKTEIVNYNKSALDPETPERTGYTFAGWDKFFDNVKSDLVVTAIYLINTYTVTFRDYNGEVLKIEVVNYNENATAPENPDNKLGHHFIRWNCPFINIIQITDVFAVYEINKYEVVFKDFDGTVIKTELVEYTQSSTEPEISERVGYTFTGWDKSFEEITSDLVVTATYKINTYTVTFLGCNNEILKIEIVNYDNAATAPENLEITGYTFTGWDNFFNEVTNDLVVTAIYEINTYTVIFTDYNDEILSAETVKYGSDATPPMDPIRKGYLFIGWEDGFLNVTKDVSVKALYDVVKRKLSPIAVISIVFGSLSLIGTTTIIFLTIFKNKKIM